MPPDARFRNAALALAGGAALPLPLLPGPRAR
jgi:hypothetical protein